MRDRARRGGVSSSRPAVLGYWMNRVLKERKRVRRRFSPAAVHDLRVALRRCRSMADGLQALQPHPKWRRMKKAGGRVFKALGELRDTQVMMKWIRALGKENDPVTQSLLKLLAGREAELQQKADRAMRRFSVKKWRKWAARLEPLSVRIPPDGLEFRRLALERWQEAFALHQQARKMPTPRSYHRLRIGLKRFRYTVENFLPARHAAWGKDLRRVQDLLGEYHDLQVLRPALRQAGPVFDAAARRRWRVVLEREKRKRLEAYRRLMTPARWEAWRVNLAAAEETARAA